MTPAAIATPPEADLDPLAGFPIDHAVHPHPREHIPWSEEAILWLPDGPPLFGRRRIEATLAERPALLPVALGGDVDLTPTGDHALEYGHGRRVGRAMRYFRLWRRTLGGDWRIAREVWDEAVDPGQLFLSPVAPTPGRRE